ncbi:MAG: hypothetical protein AB7G28_22725 [Pirellulales bacterium]
MSTATENSTLNHVQTWSGSQTARVTEMANAGKRGKRCRVLRFMGWACTGGDETSRQARYFTDRVLHYLNQHAANESLDDVKAAIDGIIAEGGLPEHCLRVYEESVRGVDAPRKLLTAGVDGLWSAKADEGGISIDDLSDQLNMPCCITPSTQKDSAAYDRAAKVWEKVQAAATFSEACLVLREAGCQLHYYCRMD